MPPTGAQAYRRLLDTLMILAAIAAAVTVLSLLGVAAITEPLTP